MAVYQIMSRKGTICPPMGEGYKEFLNFVTFQANRLAEKAVQETQKLTRARTGFMRSQVRYWSLRVYSRGGFVFWYGWRAQDFSGKKAMYPRFVESGSGIYAGRGKIVPLKAKRLAWEYAGRWVSAKSVRGQRPQNILGRVAIKMQKEVLKIVSAAHIAGFTKAYK